MDLGIRRDWRLFGIVHSLEQIRGELTKKSKRKVKRCSGLRSETLNVPWPRHVCGSLAGVQEERKQMRTVVQGGVLSIRCGRKGRCEDTGVLARIGKACDQEVPSCVEREQFTALKCSLCPKNGGRGKGWRGVSISGQSSSRVWS